MESKDLTEWKMSGSFVFRYSSWDLSEKIEKQMYFSFRLYFRESNCTDMSHVWVLNGHSSWAFWELHLTQKQVRNW
jgi:hypothetical protein